MNLSEYLTEKGVAKRPYGWCESFNYEDFDFSELKGLTAIAAWSDEETVCIEFDDFIIAMFHDQDCCESVYVESIVGDLNDLIGNEILLAEESTNSEDNPPEYADSFTWTFYKIATIKGYIDIRWLGESNGYYSESVNTLKYMKK